MEKVSIWREEHKDKPEYHLDHPEEQRYRIMRDETDQKLKVFSEKYEEAKNLLTDAYSDALEADDSEKKVTNIPTINID